eukprot:7287650-Alexandrium_andersonii.AAC.1
MSASLVGSEMCIRDSGRVEHRNDPSSNNGEAILAGGVRARVPAAAVGTCLLYTSDAADDM